MHQDMQATRSSHTAAPACYLKPAREDFGCGSYMLKCREVATHSRARWKASLMPSSHSVSSESTRVAPMPPKESLPLDSTPTMEGGVGAAAPYAADEL